MSEGTLLLVDDSAIDTRVLASLFSREGYTVITAASAMEAVAQLVRVTPDIVITDIFMPDVDGYDLCRHIRAEPAWRWLPILGLTQAAELEAKLRGFEAGVDDFVSKDTPSPELLARVGALVARRRAMLAGAPTAGVRQQPTRRVVTFFSLKGGTGTSTLATNVALLLARRHGETVGLLDLALQQGCCEVLLDLSPRVTLGTLAADEVNPRALGPAEIRRLVTVHPAGVALLPAPREPEDAERVSVELTTAALEALAFAYGYVVVDTPSGFTEHVLRALDLTDLVVLVATPDMASGKATVAALRILRELGFGDDRLLLVVNAPHGEAGIDHEQFEKAIGLAAGVAVPHDPLFSHALNHGQPRALRDERRPTRASGALIELAKRVDEKLAATSQRAVAATRTGA